MVLGKGRGWSRVRLDVGPIRGILGLACDQLVIINFFLYEHTNSFSLCACVLGAGSGSTVGRFRSRATNSWAARAFFAATMMGSGSARRKRATEAAESPRTEMLLATCV